MGQPYKFPLLFRIPRFNHPHDITIRQENNEDASQPTRQTKFQFKDRIVQMLVLVSPDRSRNATG